MKLFEAMILATTFVKHKPGDWNTCALGGAGTVVGIPLASMILHPETRNLVMAMPDGRSRAEWIQDEWSWLKGKSTWRTFGRPWSAVIAHKFDTQVCHGLITYEQFIHYVRSVDPDCVATEAPAEEMAIAS